MENMLVEISGDLLNNPKAIEWLKEHSKQNCGVACIGGGTQINQAFKKKGYKIEFDPFGRIYHTLAEKQLAMYILKKNRIIFQGLLDEKGINLKVIIPVLDIGGVLCPVNGDVMLLAAHKGFGEFFRLTLKDRVKKKELWFKKAAKILEMSDKGWREKIWLWLKNIFITTDQGDLNKIKVIGL